MGTATPLVWHRWPKLLVVSAMRPLASLLELVARQRPEWVVIVRTHREFEQVFHYAYRTAEVEQMAGAVVAPETTLEDAFNLKEDGSTPVTHGRRAPTQPPHLGGGPAAQRVICQDATGAVVEIGEPDPDAALRVLGAGLGKTRGKPTGGSAGAVPSAPTAMPLPSSPTIDSSLSAEAPAEVQVGQSQLIQFRIEFADEAQPLAHELRSATRTDRPIAVLLSLDNEGLQVTGPHEHLVAPPAQGQPQVGFFTVRGDQAGTTRAAVRFLQGSSELGAITLAIDVVTAQSSSARTRGISELARVDPRDDDMLVLEIEERLEGRQRHYEFRLRNEALGLPFDVLKSRPLLDRGDKPAKVVFDYVERIYARTTQDITQAADLDELQRKLRALGASLSDELFEPEVVSRLWPLRSRIGLIRLVSWEPYIPWELLRMRDPSTGEVDDRYLAEYGLVRTLTGETAARTLALRDWVWFGAEFPLLTHKDCGDMGYFTNTLPNAHGIRPARIAGTVKDFLDTLHDARFDLLHVACHAESPQERMDRAWLVLGDRSVLGTSDPTLVRVDLAGVKVECTRLRERRPLVFLNACETGRVGPNLTAWGGWPEVFLRAGAGAFVGTSWAVCNEPAAAFARAFYDALLTGRMLHEAATAGRGAAKAFGDASWLAYKVYGHPWAVRA